jgi:hypothetical protein
VRNAPAALWSALTCQRFGFVRQKRRQVAALQIKHRPFAIACSLLLMLAVSACTQGTRRSGLPAGAQAALDTAIEDINAGRYEKLYNDAAPEWRADASLEDSKTTLERVREKLGRPGVRNQQTAREEQTGTGHTVIVIYQTSFERGEGMETFTLVDRGGTWQLAKYFISSTGLK